MGNPALAVPFTTPVADWLATAVGDADYDALFGTAKFDRLVDDDGNAIPPVPASGVPANAGAIWGNEVDDQIRGMRAVFRGDEPITSLTLYSPDGDDTSIIAWEEGAPAVRRWELQFEGGSPQLALRSFDNAGAFVRVALTLFENDAPSPNLALFARDVQARRLLTGGGTALTSGMVTLSAGWGSTASVAVTAGSTAQRGRFTVTANGAGIAANPTSSIATPDGVFPAASIFVVRTNGGTGASHTIFPTLASVTPIVLTHAFTPVAGLTYIVDYGVIS